ncbi:NAD(P)-dependent oxidoreductase [Vagococcus jeotgali]|uniref:NAD(P)-dependent oxidoreductase n=1 Tax=Vagococcus jeotgali TaxID=3109030 RepID=UPI002DD909F7|nr:NAD(P)-dependent oxidoreductase [Vagococcus sp. B2T-5]
MMTSIFIAMPLPEESINVLKENKLSYTIWDSLDHITEDQLCEKVKDVTVLISSVSVNVSQEVIESAPNLKLIANVGDGYSNIDMDVAKAKGITVTNAPTIDSIASTAEQTVTLLLALSRQILAGDKMMRNHAFPGWSVTGYLGGDQVYGKKMVIIGLGRVGKMVAQMMQPFNMDLYYVDPIKADNEFEKANHIKRVSLEEGLALADYVTLNCDLNADNYHMFTLDTFNLMKPSAYWINCARGPLVKEADLVTALQDKKIAGAALDVYEFEPEVSDALAEIPNTVLTPHGGNATVEARKEMAMDAVMQAVHFTKGEPLEYVVK